MNHPIHRRNTLTSLMAAAGIAAATLLSACGETRYVVVQSPSAAAAPAAAAAAAVPATTAVPTTTVDADDNSDTTDDSTESDASAPETAVAETTVAPAAPAVAGPASAEDSTAIQAAISGALDLDQRTYEERSPFLTGAEDLAPTYVAVTKVLEGIDGTLRFGEITTDGDTALAIVDVIVSGADFAAGLPVDLLRVDGEWKVTRSGACAVLTLASPCPDL